MAKSYLSLKYQEFKYKFSSYFIHKKKLKALENYSEVVDFEGSKYIRILKELLRDGFLDQEEERFLDHQVRKAEIDAFSWCHRTKWLKTEMKRLSGARMQPKDNQLYMPLGGFREESKMPVAAVAIIQSTATASKRVYK